MSVIEIIASVFFILYVILAAKENIWCWLFGALASIVGIYISIVAKYYFDSLLQFFYFIMAFYGYWNWNRKEINKNIYKLSMRFNFLLIFLGIIATISFGYLSDSYYHILPYLNKPNEPYLDSFTTIFALIATFMVVKKVIENWIYWFIVNITTAYLYSIVDFDIYACLYILCTIMSVFGYFSWKKQLNTLL